MISKSVTEKKETSEGWNNISWVFQHLFTHLGAEASTPETKNNSQKDKQQPEGPATSIAAALCRVLCGFFFPMFLWLA